MDRKHRDLFAVVVGIIIAAALFSAFSVSLFHKTPAVVLPSLTPVPTESGGASSERDYQKAEVTPDTVARVVATFARPESYSRAVTVETRGADGAFSAVTASVMVDGGWTRVESVLADGRKCHSLLGEGSRYVWYGSESTWRVYDAREDGDDLAQRIPTYEDIVAAEEGSITSAGYGLIGSTPCVYAAVAVEELGYTEKYWVSVESGLLVYAESTDAEGEVFYRMSAENLETPATPGISFALPDGTVLHTTAPLS